MNDAEHISYFGVTNGRPPPRRFGIKQKDRLAHLYAIGRTGTGKTTLLETLALQDIRGGRGLAVIDPHGDLAERLSREVPASRLDDLVYFDVADEKQPYGYNPLRRIRLDKVPLAASGLLEAFKKLWGDAWGVRMEHVLRNALYALLEYGDATLVDILRLLTDKPFRVRVLARVTNPQVLDFWKREFPQYNPRYRQEAIAPIQNKVSAFLVDPRLHRLLTKPQIDLHIRRMMDEGKILIVNLSKGRLGEDTANLLGALLISTISLAAFSRAEVPEDERRVFFLYVDEFQNFTTLSVANMVSELRKYKVGLILANQHLHQLDPDVRQAVLANVGTLVVFRVGPEDAPLFAREFAPTFTTEGLVNLPFHDFYVRLMIDGVPSRPFSGTTLRPSE